MFKKFSVFLLSLPPPPTYRFSSRLLFPPLRLFSFSFTAAAVDAAAAAAAVDAVFQTQVLPPVKP
jgi:hypothetical protein